MTSCAVTQIKEGEWTSDKNWDILGIKVPQNFTKDPTLLANYISNFETRPDDVFVVTYPKSGTTWVKEIVWQIYNEGAVSKENQVLRRFPFFEALSCNANQQFRVDFKTMQSPRLIHSHLTYGTTPRSADKDAQCKYIYVSRNPKDTAVSYFHFTEHLKRSGNGYNGPWEFFCKLFIEGSVGWNCWNDHVLDWWKHKDDPNVLFLKYEDLHKDLPFHVRIIADFLNKPLSDELINRIAKQCTFKGMKENMTSYILANSQEQESSPLLRKGVVGEWKSYFSPEQNERFEKEVLAKLKGTGLEFDFEI